MEFKEINDRQCIPLTTVENYNGGFIKYYWNFRDKNFVSVIEINDSTLIRTKSFDKMMQNIDDDVVLKALLSAQEKGLVNLNKEIIL